MHCVYDQCLSFSCALLGSTDAQQTRPSAGAVKPFLGVSHAQPARHLHMHLWSLRIVSRLLTFQLRAMIQSMVFPPTWLLSTANRPESNKTTSTEQRRNPLFPPPSSHAKQYTRTSLLLVLCHCSPYPCRWLNWRRENSQQVSCFSAALPS